MMLQENHAQNLKKLWLQSFFESDESDQDKLKSSSVSFTQTHLTIEGALLLEMKEEYRPLLILVFQMNIWMKM